jgi:tetratricopeptide (TPR) repeat protein
LVSAFHTGAWLSVNHFEHKMISRIQFHLDENRERERWASAYGYVALGKYYVLTDRIPEALSAFDRSIKINPSYSQNRLAYGYQLWRVGKYQEALTQMEKARAINPTNPGIRKFLAHFYREYARMLMDSGRTGEAELYLKKLFELDPAWRPGLEALVDFYRNRLKDPEKTRYYEGLLNQK